MAKFDQKTYNDKVFQKYLSKVPNDKLNMYKKSGVLKVNQELAKKLPDEVGGNYIVEPIKGLLDGDVINYDGETNLTTTSRKTFEQGKIVVGRAKGWQEKDFSTDITGARFLPYSGIAQEVREYFDNVDQQDILAILEGIFSMSDTEGAKFVRKHTNDISGVGDGCVKAGTLNKTVTKAAGDNKKIFAMAIMHSDVSVDLETLQLISYLTYTDKDGIQRELSLATWNGKLVLVDDESPTEDVDAVYTKTSDEALDDTKTYYTRSGSGTTASPYVYTAVTTPNVSNIGSYYEMTAAAYTKYTTYILGKGSIEYADCPVKVPSEVARDPETNGGIDKLYTRQRKLYAPKFISFTKASMAKSSPTVAELKNGANWVIVNDGDNTSKTYVKDKLIPFARLISRVSSN